ncbi:MinD/ParA family protein [Roseococcus sp. SYP-B2431]|uniref:nucleotide-binding protein n=1 Tax=Roseococcus sp. SYP-B2431 TaxID=2496640 RepID=UPI00103944B5|nr:P-loop NTPase [Roseococcus sp. SYP-B2431]TCH98661.1 MinD/ParA family protein [Roseococcus sp. SYP-B2431]
MLIAIASGKGGVGKTCLAIGLAQALAEAGRDVLLVDGDLGLANVDVQLGLHPGRDLGDVLSGRCGIGEAAIPHPAGFGVLPGRSGSTMLAALDGSALIGLLRRQGREVVLDLGAGLGAAQRHLAARADLLVVVATEEPTSLTDAYAVLKLHRGDAPAARAGVVVNMVAQRAQALKVHAALDSACRNFLGSGVPLLGAVRRDPKVPAAIRAQIPLLTRHPSSPAAQDLRELAARLAPGQTAFA